MLSWSSPSALRFQIASFGNAQWKSISGLVQDRVEVNLMQEHYLSTQVSNLFIGKYTKEIQQWLSAGWGGSEYCACLFPQHSGFKSLHLSGYAQDRVEVSIVLVCSLSTQVSNLFIWKYTMEIQQWLCAGWGGSECCAGLFPQHSGFKSLHFEIQKWLCAGWGGSEYCAG